MEDFLRDSPFEETSRADPENRQYKPDYDSTNPLTDYEFAQAQAYNSKGYDAGPQMYATDNTNEVPASDPYFEAFDFLGSPTQQPLSPMQGNVNTQDPIGYDALYGDSLQFNMNAPDPINNLDRLVSPDSGAGFVSGNMFNSSQYFSPNTRTDQFGPLNAIAEDQLSRLFLNNTFSPELSRHGSVSVAPPKQELYLLPNAFLSPQSVAYDGLFDTLKSPYLGLYLNSPPPLNLSQSTSIPTAPSYNQAAATIGNALSPPQQYDQYGLGMSAPSPSGNHIRKGSDAGNNSKNLTQEEKVKRRREFHNAVERRRRDLIKEKIKELGQLVPPLLLTPQVCAVQTLQKQPHLALKEIKELLASVKVKETKPNKAMILLTSVDYIRHLQYVLSQQDRKRKEIEDQIALLNQGSSTGTRTSSSTGQSDQFGQSASSEFNPDDFFSDVITDRTQF